MIEEQPFAFVFHDAMVVGPAPVVMLCHDDALEVPRTKRIVRHSIGQRLRTIFLTHPGEGEVVMAFTLEGVWTFLEAVGQTFHSLACNANRTIGYVGIVGVIGIGIIRPSHLHLSEVFVHDFLHVVLQSCTAYAHARPIDVGLSVVVDKHAGVDARYTLDGFRFTRERTLWLFGSGYADGKASSALWCIGEVEVVGPILVNTVGSPHGIACGIAPGHILL